MERSRLDLILGVVAIAALAFAAWMYASNRSLHHDLEKLKLRVVCLKLLRLSGSPPPRAQRQLPRLLLRN